MKVLLESNNRKYKQYGLKISLEKDLEMCVLNLKYIFIE